jgi:hypothetical protein
MPTGPSFTAPVTFIETDDPHAAPERGIALCLSGGGYRAMVFHVGALWRRIRNATDPLARTESPTFDAKNPCGSGVASGDQRSELALDLVRVPLDGRLIRAVKAGRRR